MTEPSPATNPPEGDPPDPWRYFKGEALAAENPDHPSHLSPVYPPGARVISVGCGGGWAGEDVGTTRFVGIDIDEEAQKFRLARKATSEFRLGNGEQLPFDDGEFTFYMARVSLMYMDIRKALSEAHRVLSDGGVLWITCHDPAHEVEHLRRNLRSFHVRAILYRIYVILNGLLYHSFGGLVRYPLNRRRMESFQTRAGIRRGLQRAGFVDVAFPKTKHGQFLVTARKAG